MDQEGDDEEAQQSQTSPDCPVGWAINKDSNSIVWEYFFRSEQKFKSTRRYLSKCKRCKTGIKIMTNSNRVRLETGSGKLEMMLKHINSCAEFGQAERKDIISKNNPDLASAVAGTVSVNSSVSRSMAGQRKLSEYAVTNKHFTDKKNFELQVCSFLILNSLGSTDEGDNYFCCALPVLKESVLYPIPRDASPAPFQSFD